MSNEGTVRFDAQAYFSMGDNMWGFKIKKGDKVIIESRPIFKTAEEAQKASSEILQAGVDAMKEKGIPAFRTGDN